MTHLYPLRRYAAFSALTLALTGLPAAAATVAITQTPPCGGGPDVMATIGGTTTDAEKNTHRVILFAGTDRWYVQPYTAAPFTIIGRDGRWTAQTHLGRQYAAVLVTSSFKAPATTFALPEIGNEVLAVEVVPCGGGQ